MPQWLTCALLAAIAFRTLSGAAGTNADDLHDRVGGAIDAAPRHVGDWVGSDQAVPQDVIRLLRPHAMLSRTYTHAQTGDEVHLALAHYRDARQVVGHHPTICYPANGWTLLTRPERHESGGHAMSRYTFIREEREGVSGVDVYCLAIVPGKQAGSGSPASLLALVDDYRRAPLGAALLQIAVPAQTTDARQAEIVSALLDAYRPILRVLSSDTPTAANLPSTIATGRSSL